MKNILVALGLCGLILVSFFSGVYFVGLEMKGFYQSEIQEMQEDRSSIIAMFPSTNTSQIEMKFIVSTALKTIEMIEEERISDLKGLNCVTLKFFSEGIEPRYAETPEEEKRLTELRESGLKKASQLEAEGSCLTSGSSSGTAQSAAP